MKKIILTILLMTGTLLAELQWASSYEEGLVQAKQENKPLMLMFSTKTCKMCNYMKEVVYEDDDVVEYVDTFFIPVEVDIENHPDKYGYKVFGTPTYYFLTPNGQQIGRTTVGGAKPKAFLDLLQSVLKQAKK